jgi:hypothetical protein
MPLPLGLKDIARDHMRQVYTDPLRTTLLPCHLDGMSCLSDRRRKLGAKINRFSLSTMQDTFARQVGVQARRSMISYYHSNVFLAFLLERSDFCVIRKGGGLYQKYPHLGQGPLQWSLPDHARSSSSLIAPDDCVTLLFTSGTVTVWSLDSHTANIFTLRVARKLV